MKLEDLKTIGQLEDFLSDTQVVAFAFISDKDNGYCWIQGKRYAHKLLALWLQFFILRVVRHGEPPPLPHLNTHQHIDFICNQKGVQRHKCIH